MVNVGSFALGMLPVAAIDAAAAVSVRVLSRRAAREARAASTPA